MLNDAKLFSKIRVNAKTGAMSYPAPAGFELDFERVEMSAESRLAECGGDIALAVRHAIYEQLIARANDELDAVFGGVQ